MLQTRILKNMLCIYHLRLLIGSIFSILSNHILCLQLELLLALREPQTNKANPRYNGTG